MVCIAHLANNDNINTVKKMRVLMPTCARDEHDVMETYVQITLRRIYLFAGGLADVRIDAVLTL